VLGLCAGPAPAADAPTRADKAPLRLTIRLDRDAYKAGDRVALRFDLRNESQAPLYVGDGFLAPASHEVGPHPPFALAAAPPPTSPWPCPPPAPACASGAAPPARARPPACAASSAWRPASRTAARSCCRPAPSPRSPPTRNTASASMPASIRSPSAMRSTTT